MVLNDWLVVVDKIPIKNSHHTFKQWATNSLAYNEEKEG